MESFANDVKAGKNLMSGLGTMRKEMKVRVLHKKSSIRLDHGRAEKGSHHGGQRPVGRMENNGCKGVPQKGQRQE